MTNSPRPQDIIDLRVSAGMSQETAAGVLLSCCSTYQKWESGRQKLHPAMFEYFKIKVGVYRQEHPGATLRKVGTPRAERLAAKKEADNSASAQIAKAVRPDPLLDCLMGPSKDVVKWINRPRGARTGQFHAQSF